jgi:AcrR family transcriptional regulator
MENQYQKKKDSIATRELILDTATDIGASDWSSLTFQHLADKSGISKGGIMHHYKNRDELLDAIVERSLIKLKDWTLAYQNVNNLKDSGMAYLHAVLATEKDERYLRTMRIIVQAVLFKAEYLNLWNNWYKENVVQEIGKSRTKSLIAMLIADGIWYSETFGLTQISKEDKDEIVKYLNS